MIRLTDEQKLWALELRKTGEKGSLAWRRVGKIMGIPERALLREFSPAVYKREIERHKMRRRADNKTALGVRPPEGARPVRVLIPDEVLSERNAAYSRPLPLVYQLLGDPRPGRSALDRRNGG